MPATTLYQVNRVFLQRRGDGKGVQPKETSGKIYNGREIIEENNYRELGDVYLGNCGVEDLQTETTWPTRTKIQASWLFVQNP